MKNLWPQNLFPLSLLGPGLRISSTFIRSIFSGKPDPVRIYVELPLESTLAFEDSMMTQTMANDIKNEILLVTPEKVSLNDAESVFAIEESNVKPTISINTEKTLVTL